jgi:hypothetical protein
MAAAARAGGDGSGSPCTGDERGREQGGCGEDGAWSADPQGLGQGRPEQGDPAPAAEAPCGSPLEDAWAAATSYL